MIDMTNPRDLREEVLVNRGEQLQIIEAATKVGLSKSAFMRSSSLKVANDIMRKERQMEAGLLTDDWRMLELTKQLLVSGYFAALALILIIVLMAGSKPRR